MRGMIFPFNVTDTSLPEQPLTDPVAPIEGAELDMVASLLPLGASPSRWESHSSTRWMQFSSTRPVVMDEAGVRFVRFNGGEGYSSVGTASLTNPLAFTRFARVRFIGDLHSSSLSSVYGNGTPNLYLDYGDGSAPAIAMHSGTALRNTMPLAVDTWYSIIAVFNRGSSVLRINGTETAGTSGTATSEAGFTFGFRNGTGYPGRVWDLARGGQINGALTLAERGALEAQLSV